MILCVNITPFAFRFWVLSLKWNQYPRDCILKFSNQLALLINLFFTFLVFSANCLRTLTPQYRSLGARFDRFAMGPQTTVNEQLFNLNFGPQHPSAHGVLRLILQLSGERILQADAHIGLLHRGTEKLLESRSYEKGLGYFDRLDYVSMMAQEHAFTVVVERLLSTSVATPTNLIRILFLELTRLLNHILSITTHAMDVGAFTPFLWGFEEREKIMEFYERVSGARMHALFIRPRSTPGHLNKNLERTAALAPLMLEIHQFAGHMDSRISELAMLLSTNRIWYTRLHQVGYVSKDTALSWGFSGPLLRGSGVP